MFRIIYFPTSKLLCLGTIVFLNILAPSGAKAESDCTYTSYTWNTQLGRAIDYRTIRKPYSDLKAEEIHSETGCTVCEEDMSWVSVPGVEPVMVCARLAPLFQSALDFSLGAGEHIEAIVGRRVGRTKGQADDNGNRTLFSFHSYGIALDVNPARNGLYTDCYTFGPHCRMLQGGPWVPGSPGSHTAESVLVQELKARGFKWGGEIAGRQKDFMHFSPSGY
jgi:hypothetical protein